MAQQMAFYFDQRFCTGCKACQQICKDKNDLPVGALYRRVYDYEKVEWDESSAYLNPVTATAYFTSLSCNHCENPACVENCPTGAMQKDPETGIVSNDPEVCIGCKTCASVCPYSAPQFREDLGIMGKCDFCKDLVAAGNKPKCVTVCPLRALDFGTVEELQERYGVQGCDFEPLPEGVTGPSLIINPHYAAKASGSGDGTVTQLPEEAGADNASM